MTTQKWRDIDPVEAETRLGGLRRRLRSVEQELESNNAALRLKPESFAFQLSGKGLLNVQRRISGELKDLLRHRIGEILDIELDGGDFHSSSASIASLAAILIRVQKLFTGIAQAVTVGPRLRGPVQAFIRDITELSLVRVYEGSFGMTLHAPSQPNLLGVSITADTLGRMFDLLSASASEQRLVAISGEFGSRVTSQLRQLARTLVKAETHFTMKWDDTHGAQRSCRMTSATVQYILSNIEHITFTRSEARKLKGRLVGASLYSGSFELLQDGGILVAGSVIPGMSEKIQEKFGQLCEVMVDETEVIDTFTGDKRTSYVLTDITEPDPSGIIASRLPLTG